MKRPAKIIIAFAVGSLFSFALPGFTQDGRTAKTDSLKSILSNYGGFGPVKISVESKYKYSGNGDSGELKPYAHNKMEVFFSSPKLALTRVDYLSKKRWDNNSVVLSEERVSQVVGPGFFAVIDYKSGTPGNLKGQPLVRLFGEESDLRSINQFDIGARFLLLNQRVFDEIPIMDFITNSDSLESVVIRIEKDVLGEMPLHKIIFEREKKGNDESDTLFVSADMGFALVRREFVSTMSDQLRRELGKIRAEKKMSVVPEGGMETIFEMSRFQKVGQGFVPMSSQYRLVNFGEIREEMRTTFLSIKQTSDDEIRGIFSIIPKGHRVVDSRNGKVYLVGKEGMAWPGESGPKE